MTNNILDLETQTQHLTTRGVYTYEFDFDFNPYEKVLNKSNILLYINFEKVDDFTVDFDNKRVTVFGRGIEIIEQMDPATGIPNDGYEMSIIRNTNISKPSVEFSNTTRFNPKYINYNNTQLLFKQREIQDQLLYLREQLKAVDQFDEEEFSFVASELISLSNRVNQLNSLFTDVNDELNSLSSDFNRLTGDFQELSNQYSSVLDTFNTIQDEVSDLITEYQDKVSDVESKAQLLDNLVDDLIEQFEDLEGDDWRLGQIIALHPSIAAEDKDRLVLAAGQDYFENDLQVQELKNIYPVNGGVVSMPDLTTRFYDGFLSYYIVKSVEGIEGTDLE